MIFDSLGIGEVGVIVAVIIIFVDPKKVGQTARAFARFRRKWSDLQREMKQQFNTLLDEEAKDTPGGLPALKAVLRQEGRAAVRSLTAADRADAARKALEHLQDWSAYREAKTVAAFAGTLEEIDTEPVMRAVLAAGKTLLLPYVDTDKDGVSQLRMARVKNYDRDLHEGAFGILEPGEALRAESAPDPDLILIPGVAFDENGGRLGRGRGFYDRYLQGRAGFKAGLGFEAQILRKKFTLEPHDQLLDGLVTERRTMVFSKPRALPAGADPTPPA